jgi:hypothetical protein
VYVRQIRGVEWVSFRNSPKSGGASSSSIEGVLAEAAQVVDADLFFDTTDFVEDPFKTVTCNR